MPKCIYDLKIFAAIVIWIYIVDKSAKETLDLWCKWNSIQIIETRDPRPNQLWHIWSSSCTGEICKHGSLQYDVTVGLMFPWFHIGTVQWSSRYEIWHIFVISLEPFTYVVFCFLTYCLHCWEHLPFLQEIWRYLWCRTFYKLFEGWCTHCPRHPRLVHRKRWAFHQHKVGATFWLAHCLNYLNSEIDFWYMQPLLAWLCIFFIYFKCGCAYFLLIL